MSEEKKEYTTYKIEVKEYKGVPQISISCFMFENTKKVDEKSADYSKAGAFAHKRNGVTMDKESGDPRRWEGMNVSFNIPLADLPLSEIVTALEKAAQQSA